MTEARKILEMIESVDPADNDTMDEIDARVWCWLKGITEEGDFKVTHNAGAIHYRHNTWPCDARTILHHPFMHPDYTRSRDALKTIRPKGWEWEIITLENGSSSCSRRLENNDHLIESDTEGWLPTEELAELHAIIQAIDYERNNEEINTENGDCAVCGCDERKK